MFGLTYEQGRHDKFKPGKEGIVYTFLANFGYHPLVVKFLETTIKKKDLFATNE